MQTDLNHFWDTTSAMASLVGLIVNGVFKELGAGVEARMERVAGLYNEFIGHTGFVRRKRPGRCQTLYAKIQQRGKKT